MKQTLLLAAIAYLSLGMASAPANAQAKSSHSIDEALSLRLIRGPRISPDGRFVIYSVRETNWKDNEFVRQLWLVNVSTGKSFQLTRGKKSAGRAEWSPDGRWIAFVT